MPISDSKFAISTESYEKGRARCWDSDAEMRKSLCEGRLGDCKRNCYSVKAHWPRAIVMASNNFSIVAANVCAVAEFTCKTGLVSKTCNPRNVPLKPLPRQLPLAPSHFCLLSFVASTRIYPQQAAKEYTKPYIANPTKLPWTPTPNAEPF